MSCLLAEPHRFITRQSEVTKEPPGKELILDEASRISVRDKQHREKCTIQNELQLAEAWTRRSLACDLMQVTTFSSMEKWHRFLLSRLSLSPPPHFQPTNIEQLLRCDRAAWMRLSELVPSRAGVMAKAQVKAPSVMPPVVSSGRPSCQTTAYITIPAMAAASAGTSI